MSSVSVTATASKLPDALAALYRGREGGDHALAAAAADVLVQGYGAGLLAGAGALLMAAVVVVAAVTTRQTQSAAAAAVV